MTAGIQWQCENPGKEEYWLRTNFNLNSLSEIIKIPTRCQMQFSIPSPGLVHCMYGEKPGTD